MGVCISTHRPILDLASPRILGQLFGRCRSVEIQICKRPRHRHFRQSHLVGIPTIIGALYIVNVRVSLHSSTFSLEMAVNFNAA